MTPTHESARERIDTKDIVLSFGKHKGMRIQRVPVNYLRFMVREGTPQADVAEAEMDRRGTHVPKIEVSGHAIDTASLRIRKQWHEDRGENEGLHAWLCRVAWEAWNLEERSGSERVDHKGVRWVFVTEGGWPMLKTVMRSKGRRS